ncbi:LacI family DNA-binding transcriptional regulator [Streptantibioticus silvisoli]|uniref:LacI family DNA-binding transcriptional regulator n=1 Tax=Streptantibioticus silvisoli TaxID=2705255 RepID=A0ABT6W5W6_9ACTN|nr:LacI family DNA-binding transcriptional regulator [Streptantibioticus silvisoli]MDI5966142.1 LacI family DNA-binding transcriptional regulator [Streptantibioticus silvisoli]
MPTVYEVAALAGVSTASVSRVLAGNDRVRLETRPETRTKVLAAVAELGHLPSAAAQNLANLGLCFPDPVGDQDIVESDAMYWYDEVIRGMERAARRSGFAVLIAAGHADDDRDTLSMVVGRCGTGGARAHGGQRDAGAPGRPDAGGPRPPAPATGTRSPTRSSAGRCPHRCPPPRCPTATPPSPSPPRPARRSGGSRARGGR